MKERPLADRIRTRLKETKPLIQVVEGPRQVGKTTAVKAALAGRGLFETADFPTPLPVSVIEKWWEKALSLTDHILVIDEIQKIPGWSEILKRLWDGSNRKLKVVVTGSSALLLEKGLKESLAGRFELIRANHWNWSEAKKVFGLTLEQYLEYGCYPGAVPFLENVERWGAYVRDSIVEPALGRDLLQLHPVDQPALLRQVFSTAVSLPAQIITLQKIQGQLEGRGSLPTIRNYLDLLSKAYLVTGIEKYSDKPFRVKKSSPKLIVHDNGLVRAFERPIQGKQTAELKGRYLENCIGARFIEAGWETYYWKDRDYEVDFVVLGPKGERWAIEVKLAPPPVSELRGVQEFCRRYPDFQPKLVTLGKTGVGSVDALELESLLCLDR